MGNSNIKPHIESAGKTGACNLNKQGISEFPEELLKISNKLRNLDLSENKVLTLPPRIGNFSMMKTLKLNNNKLGYIPEEIGHLRKLESLTLDCNRLAILPETLSQLQNLKKITITNNQLKDFPLQLIELKNLDSIDLSRNKITCVPEAVSGSNAIEINLNQNQISALPESIAGCAKLKVLRLEENCLTLAAFTPKIMKESQISLLAIEGNVFELKSFHNIEGYDEYMERYTATKKKFN